MPTKLDDEIQRLNMVAPAAWVKKIDDWRRREPDLPNLSEAIRRLVDMGWRAPRRAAKGVKSTGCAVGTEWFVRAGVQAAAAVSSSFESVSVAIGPDPAFAAVIRVSGAPQKPC